MRVFIYVEGASDRDALKALWRRWIANLNSRGIGVEIPDLKNKAEFLKNIGARAAQNLAAPQNSLVVGLPDLYPTHGFKDDLRHSCLEELCELQRRKVGRALKDVYGVRQDDIDCYLERFKPSALKYDLEMLLLAVGPKLREYLDAPVELKRWRRPVEDQDDNRPPKKVVQDIFAQYGRGTKRQYYDTIHARAVLGLVDSIDEVFRDSAGLRQCPAFEELCQWLGAKTGIPVC